MFATNHPAIGQNQEINTCPKRNAALSTFEVTGHLLWNRDTH
jgi:hypothetical protein